MAIAAALLYKAIPAEPQWSRVVTYWYPSSPTVQFQYPMGISAARL